MLDILVLIVDVISALFLVVFILLHSGKGGGLSDMFGGGSMSTMSGSTVVERNLDRLTVVTAVVFAMTTVLLGLRLT